MKPIEVMRARAATAHSTWSSVNKHSDVSLSNSDMTATGHGATTWETVFGSLSRTSGKYQFELVSAAPSGSMGGIATSDMVGTFGTYIGSTNDGSGHFINNLYGAWHLAGYSKTGTFLAWGSGDTLTVAVDFTAQTAQFYVNGSASQLLTVFAPFGVLYPACSLQSGDAQTLRVTGLTYPVVGYSDWG